MVITKNYNIYFHKSAEFNQKDQVEGVFIVKPECVLYSPDLKL